MRCDFSHRDDDSLRVVSENVVRVTVVVGRRQADDGDEVIFLDQGNGARYDEGAGRDAERYVGKRAPALLVRIAVEGALYVRPCRRPLPEARRNGALLRCQTAGRIREESTRQFLEQV
jgi:hypothetical protein